MKTRKIILGISISIVLLSIAGFLLYDIGRPGGYDQKNTHVNPDVSENISNTNASTTTISESSTTTPTQFSDSILILGQPLVQSLVTSPLTVKGKIDTSWVVQGQLPINLFDSTGKEIASTTAIVSGNASSTGLRSFTAIVRFTKPITDTGMLIIKKQNPLGYPILDDQRQIMLRFSSAVLGSCRPTGCNAIICADHDIVTVCMQRPEYICYKQASCQKQSDGECGWTPTSQLTQCLLQKSGIGTTSGTM